MYLDSFSFLYSLRYISKTSVLFLVPTLYTRRRLGESSHCRNVLSLQVPNFQNKESIIFPLFSLQRQHFSTSCRSRETEWGRRLLLPLSSGTKKRILKVILTSLSYKELNNNFKNLTFTEDNDGVYTAVATYNTPLQRS